MRLSFICLLLLTPILCSAQRAPVFPEWQEASLGAALRDPMAKGGALDFMARNGAPEKLWPELGKILATKLVDPDRTTSAKQVAVAFGNAKAVQEAALALARSGARAYIPEVRQHIPDFLKYGFDEEFFEALTVFQDRESLPTIEHYLEDNPGNASMLAAVESWHEYGLAMSMLKAMRAGCFLPKQRTYCSPFIGQEIRIVNALAPAAGQRFLNEARSRKASAIDKQLARAVASPAPAEPRSAEEALQLDPDLKHVLTITFVGDSGNPKYSDAVLKAIREEYTGRHPEWLWRLSKLLISAKRLGIKIDRSWVFEAAGRSDFLDVQFTQTFGPFPLEERLRAVASVLQSRGEGLSTLYLESGVDEVNRIRPYLEWNDQGHMDLAVSAQLSAKDAHRLLRELESLFSATITEIQSLGKVADQESLGQEGNLTSLAAILADRMEQAVRRGENIWVTGDIVDLTRTSELLSKGGFEKEASSVIRVRDEVYSRAEYLKAVLAALGTIAIWSVSWAFLLSLYPHSRTIRTVFLSPSVLRRIWSAGFVDVALLRSRGFGAAS